MSLALSRVRVDSLVGASCPGCEVRVDQGESPGCELTCYPVYICIDLPSLDICRPIISRVCHFHREVKCLFPNINYRAIQHTSIGIHS